MTSAPTKLPSTSSGAGHRVSGGDEAKHTQSIPGGYTPSTVGPRMSALLANIPTQQTGAPTHRGDYTATRTTAAISAPVADIEDSEFSDVSETEDTGFSPLEAEPQVPFMRLITGKQAGEMLLARFPEKPGIYAAREYLESQFGPPLTLTYLTALLYMAYRDYGRTMSEPSRQTAARMRDVLREVDPEKGIGRSEIARKLGIDQLLHQNSLGRHIDELVRSGLVTRTTENKRIIIRPLPKLHEVSDIGSERTLREITTAVREWKKNHDHRPSIMEIRQQLTMPEKMKANRFNLLVKACIDARYGLTRHDSRATRKDVTARASKYTNAIHEEMRRAPGNALSGSAIALYLTEKKLLNPGQTLSIRNIPGLRRLSEEEAEEVSRLQKAENYRLRPRAQCNNTYYTCAIGTRGADSERKKTSLAEQHASLSAFLDKLPSNFIITLAALKRNIGGINQATINDLIREGRVTPIGGAALVTTGTQKTGDAAAMATFKTDVVQVRPTSTRVTSVKMLLLTLHRRLQQMGRKLPDPIENLGNPTLIYGVAKLKAELKALQCTSSKGFEQAGRYFEQYPWSPQLFLEADVPDASFLCSAQGEKALRPDAKPLANTKVNAPVSAYRGNFIAYVDKLNNWLSQRGVAGRFEVSTSGTLTASYSERTEHPPYAKGEASKLRRQSYVCDVVLNAVNALERFLVTPEIQMQLATPRTSEAQPAPGRRFTDIVMSGNSPKANLKIAQVLGLQGLKPVRQTLPSGVEVDTWTDVDFNAVMGSLGGKLREKAASRPVPGWHNLERRLNKLEHGPHRLSKLIDNAVRIHIPCKPNAHADIMVHKTTEGLDLVPAGPPRGTKEYCLGCATYLHDKYKGAFQDASVIYPSGRIEPRDWPKLLALLAPPPGGTPMRLGLNTTGVKDRRPSISDAEIGPDGSDDEMDIDTDVDMDGDMQVEDFGDMHIHDDDFEDGQDIDWETASLEEVNPYAADIAPATSAASTPHMPGLPSTDDAGRHPFHQEQQTGADCAAHARNTALLGNTASQRSLTDILTRFPRDYAQAWTTEAQLNLRGTGLDLEALATFIQQVDGRPVYRFQMGDTGTEVSQQTSVAASFDHARLHAGSHGTALMKTAQEELEKKLANFPDVNNMGHMEQRRRLGHLALVDLQVKLKTTMGLGLPVPGQAQQRTLERYCREAIDQLVANPAGAASGNAFRHAIDAYNQAVTGLIDNIRNHTVAAWQGLRDSTPHQREDAWRRAQAQINAAVGTLKLIGTHPMRPGQPVTVADSLRHSIDTAVQRNLAQLDNGPALGNAIRRWAQRPGSDALIVQLRGRAGDHENSMGHIVALRVDRETRKVYVVDSLSNTQPELDLDNMDRFLKGASGVELLAFIDPSESPDQHPLLQLTGTGGREEPTLVDTGQFQGVGAGAWRQLGAQLEDALSRPEGVFFPLLKRIDAQLAALLDAPRLVELYPDAARNALEMLHQQLRAADGNMAPQALALCSGIEDKIHSLAALPALRT